jgi:hypothetical protein
VWRNKKGTEFVDSKMTCLPCTLRVRGLLHGAKKKMGLITVAVMKWMENLNVFLRGRDHREVMPVGSIEVGTFRLQKMKGFLNIKGDCVNSLLEFSPFFLPCQVPLGQHLLFRCID